MKRKYLLAAGAALAVAAGGVGIAQAVGGGDESETATGPGADRAKAAALRAIDGGRANAVERDSENGGTWEVEVTRPDGKTVDVRLDENYKVVVVEGDSEKPDDSDGE
jgi:uncharacterized membrane protein YkoI